MISSNRGNSRVFNPTRVSNLESHIVFQSKRARIRKFTKYLTRRNLSALFLDVDGTIWPDKGPGSLIEKNEVEEGIRDDLNALSKHFDYKVLVTNQTYFARQSRIDSNDVDRYFRNIRILCRSLKIDVFIACHHHPSATNLRLRRNCGFRKPDMGMFCETNSLLGIEFESSVMIGDRITDVIPAVELDFLGVFLLANPGAMQMNENYFSFSKSMYSFYLIDSLRGISGSVLDRIDD